MPRSKYVPVKGISGSRYARVITYPIHDHVKTEERVRELLSNGVTSLRINGGASIDGIPILGKGCVGIVIEGTLDDAPVALKIRRFDADRPTMGNEAKMLRLANSVGIGPRLLGSSRNVLVMELVNGAPLFTWIANSPKQENVRATLDNLLHACFKLDSIGLDHGELSHAPKNVLVTHERMPCIVDFESASTARRTANVTSILQYFLFGQVSKLVNASRLFPKKRVILRTLTTYKADQSVENFRNVREALGIA